MAAWSTPRPSKGRAPREPCRAGGTGVGGDLRRRVKLGAGDVGFAQPAVDLCGIKLAGPGADHLIRRFNILATSLIIPETPILGEEVLADQLGKAGK